jgi:uncharacterized iron-regulated membrane protein
VRIREIFFWFHLAVGLVAGAVILVMAVTGALLAFERQITDWAERGYQVAPPAPGAAHLPVEALIAKAVEGRPGARPASLTLQADAGAPALVSLGRDKTVFVDPYTGRVLGEGARSVRAFFHRVESWHRWLGAGDAGRDAARRVTGACNLGFLGLVLTGIVLWLPRKWTGRQVRNVAWFRRGLRGKARDFNWHNVLGLWSWAPLVLIVATGVVMSYPWANGLLFRLAGDRPPAGRPGGGEGGERGGRPREGAPGLEGLDELWARAERRVPGWTSLSVRMPGSARAPVSFTIARGDRGRPDLRAQLTLDRWSGEVVRWEPFSSQSRGRRWRSWARWIHTGEAGGWLGQTVAAVVSAGTIALVWTGWAMAWRRFVPRKRRAREVETAEA